MAAPQIPPGTPTDVLVPTSLHGIRIDLLCESPRVQHLDVLDSYAAARQYDRRKYNWDGEMIGGVAGDYMIAPGFNVPNRSRQPSTRFDLGKLIVRRLTAVVLGEDHWPEVRVEGDEDAEDYVKALAEAADVPTRLAEARDKGGACGTACMSFGFVDSKPRVQVHRAKHMHVLRWKDRDEFVVGAVLKCYRYTRTAWDQGRPKEVTYYFARYWDEQQERVWDPIPEMFARDGSWVSRVRSFGVQHDYGETPVYWAQNQADSELEDGCSDIEGLLPNIDALCHTASATTKGTIANVDPTLVIKDDFREGDGGIVRKGSGQAIYSKGGADYLELKGQAVQAAIALCDKIQGWSLDVAGVILGDPEKMGVQAQSGEALKFLYLPMLNEAGKLRVQYGKRLLVPLLVGMLRAARKIANAAPGPILTTLDGRRIQERPIVVLPPRVEIETTDPPSPEPGEMPERPRKPKRKPKPKLVPRVPGTSENLSLKWPPYFGITSTDMKERVEAITAAQGKIISDRTAVQAGAHLFDVQDVDRELQDLQDERLTRALEIPGPDMPGEEDGPPGGGGGGSSGEDE